MTSANAGINTDIIDDAIEKRIERAVRNEVEKVMDSVIHKATERALLLLPEVMGNLLQQQVVLKQVKEKFIKENPEVIQHKELVAKIIEKVEGNNPHLKYEEILRLALPEIRDKIRQTKHLNVTEVKRPTNRILPSLGEDSNDRDDNRMNTLCDNGNL